MTKIKTYSVTKDVADSMGRIYKIFVYGEVTEENALEGVEIRRVNYQHRSGKVVSANDKGAFILPLGDNCSPVKKLNFGYAICAPEDGFDENKGIAVARKRFSKAPLTTQDCRFLKKDMVEAILNQTAEYVATHELLEVLNREDETRRFYQNFHNGEIVKQRIHNNVGIFAIIFREDGSIYRNWVQFEHTPNNICFYNSEIPVERFKEIEKVTDEERNAVQNLFREKYHNQWDENNAKFVKA